MLLADPSSGLAAAALPAAAPVLAWAAVRLGRRLADRLPLILDRGVAALFGSCPSPDPAGARRRPWAWTGLATAGLIAAAVLADRPPHAILAMAFTLPLIVIAMVDQEHCVIPDVVVLPLAAAGLLAAAAGIGQIGLRQAIMGMAVAWLGYRLVQWLSARLGGGVGLGDGDVKLGAALGAWLGALPAVAALAVAAVAALAVAAARGQGGHRDRGELPFGPYLAGSGWLLMVFLSVLSL